MLLQEEEQSLLAKNPFNLSNDEYYTSKLTTDTSLKSNMGGTILQVGIMCTYLSCKTI